jgi:DNA-binding NarL/FixJ family response regulator
MYNDVPCNRHAFDTHNKNRGRYIAVSTINTVLVSRLVVIREGMKRILLPYEDIRILAEVGQPADILADRNMPCGAVLVVAYPEAVVGSDDLVQLRRRCPDMAMVVVVRSPTLIQVLSALRMGVRGLLHASCAASHLPAAIRAVASGKVYMAEDVSNLILADLGAASKDHTHTALTQRELEIFMRLAAGRKMSEIAVELRISIKTVSTHKTRMMDKMGMTSSSQLIQYAIVNSLFAPTPEAD